MVKWGVVTEYTWDRYILLRLVMVIAGARGKASRGSGRPTVSSCPCPGARGRP